MQPRSTPNSLQRLINDLAGAVEAKESVNPARAAELLRAADIQEADLRPFADLEYPAADCYGRGLVVDQGRFEVMVMSWKPGHYSSIHNHGYAEWGAVQVFGPVHHQVYQIEDGAMEFATIEILPKGSILPVDNALIHQMGNATSQPYLTLHLYGANELDSCVTADAKTFELEFGRVAHTTGGAFFDVQEPAIYQFEEAPPASDEVFLHYAALLMRYYHRQQQTDRILALKRSLCDQLAERLLPPKALAPARHACAATGALK